MHGDNCLGFSMYFLSGVLVVRSGLFYAAGHNEIGNADVNTFGLPYGEQVGAVSREDRKGSARGPVGACEPRWHCNPRPSEDTLFNWICGSL